MSDEKKIIIDEDWKSQVEREKEELEQKGGQAAGGEDPAEGGPADDPASMFPPASFELLISMFATDAMMAMGQIPHPATNQVEKNLDQAKYVIDLLGVIEAKTKGNLSEQEELGMTNLLHQLRLAFVEVSKQG